MQDWSFELLLNRCPTDDEVDALYEADLDDCSPVQGTKGGISYLMCDREAADLYTAVREVVQRVESIPGLQVVGARHDDTVTLGEAAQRTQGTRTKQSLHQLATAQRGPGTFPNPISDSGGIAFYSWAQIASFLRDEMGDAIDEAHPDMAIIDALLRVRARSAASGHLDDARALMAA